MVSSPYQQGVRHSGEERPVLASVSVSVSVLHNNIKLGRMPYKGPKWLAMGSKWAHSTCLGTPNDLGSLLEKDIFDPFFTHF